MTQFGVRPRMTGSKFFPTPAPVIRANIPPVEPKNQPVEVKTPPIVDPDQWFSKAVSNVWRSTVRSVGMGEIASEVAEQHGIPIADLLSARRYKRLVCARQEAWWRCRHETDKSYTQIARYFGNRDHTTILHGVKAHQKRLDAAAEMVVIVLLFAFRLGVYRAEADYGYG